MRNAPIVHPDELNRRVGMPLRLVEAEPCQDRLFQGHLSWQHLRSGLSLHCSDCIELHTFQTQVVTAPHVNFLIFLEGDSEVRYDDRTFHLGRPAGAPAGCERAATVVTSRPVQFTRQARRGKRVRKVSVSLTPEWFEAGGLEGQEALRELIDPHRDHLLLQRWQPSPRLLALAEQVLRPPAEAQGLLRTLYLESRALEIVGEAIAGFSGAPPTPPRHLRPHEMARIRRTLELLHSDAADGWSLERIAREVGVNASTLQRQFQATQGVSLFEYQRRRKLRQAREALERQGVSVSQAAWLAGYSSAANFATAFKRTFGLSPSQVRARL